MPPRMYKTISESGSGSAIESERFRTPKVQSSPSFRQNREIFRAPPTANKSGASSSSDLASESTATKMQSRNHLAWSLTCRDLRHREEDTACLSTYRS